MEAARTRRRAAIGVLGAIGAAAFAFGATLGDGASPPPADAASRLSLEQLVGERIVVGFSGTRPPHALERMIRRGDVAGVILFAENLPGRDSARRLTRSLQAIPRPPGLNDPLLVMVDQEGGQVKRIGGAPSASAAQMGARGAAFTRAQGARTAANLRDVGVNVDLAPVLDVARPGGDIAATERGFSSTPAGVAGTAVPFAAALQAGGVAATGKHFPGLGSARANTDFAVQRIRLSKAVLRRVDEAPYRSFVEGDGDLVMLSTAIYPAFSGKPAAFSRTIATGELRDRLGFEGVSITDALESVSVDAFGGPRRAALAAVGAGTDVLLFADRATGARAAAVLLARLRGGGLDRADFEDSASRVLRLRHRLGR